MRLTLAGNYLMTLAEPLQYCACVMFAGFDACAFQTLVESLAAYICVNFLQSVVQVGASLFLFRAATACCSLVPMVSASA
ncbi:hypothetical protein HDN1F_07970 [gamma proteobacterium HdN1]|nr:hypothetical protein HDN1F_07970 [gamma proteobacterium HdN1]